MGVPLVGAELRAPKRRAHPPHPCANRAPTSCLIFTAVYFAFLDFGRCVARRVTRERGALRMPGGNGGRGGVRHRRALVRARTRRIDVRRDRVPAPRTSTSYVCTPTAVARRYHIIDVTTKQYMPEGIFTLAPRAIGYIAWCVRRLRWSLRCVGVSEQLLGVVSERFLRRHDAPLTRLRLARHRRVPKA